MTTYSGSGYTTDPVYQVQQYLINRWSTTSPDALTPELEAKLTSLGQNGPVVLQNFFSSFSETNPMPPTIDSFVKALVDFIPGFTVSNQGAQIKTTIEDVIQGNLSLENSGFDQSTIAAALGDPSLQANSASFYTDVYDLAFNKFLSEFQYTGTTIGGVTAPVSGGVAQVSEAYFGSRFQDFFVKFATVVNPAGSSVNFQEIYNAFFPNSTDAQFTSFLANYISSVVYPTDGSAAQPFLPNEDIGAWMKKIQESYSISLKGSAAPTTSSVGNSFKKVVEINVVLAMIIKIIGTLQRVAAFQSDRLRILTLQQSAYTTLETQIPVFTQGDGTIFGSATLTSKTEAQSARDQANNYNQTLTETVRSKRTTVQDDAKILQSNIDGSNNAANDQASTATAFLQTISTILAAIYR